MRAQICQLIYKEMYARGQVVTPLAYILFVNIGKFGLSYHVCESATDFPETSQVN